MKTILESLQDYFNNNTEEKVKKDWEDSEDWDNQGISIDEFLNKK